MGALVAQKENRAVGWRLGHALGAARAAGAADVLDDDLMTECFGQALGEDAAHQIDRATGRERHHHGDRPGRPGLCVCRPGQQARERRRDDRSQHHFSPTIAVRSLAAPRSRCAPSPLRGEGAHTRVRRAIIDQPAHQSALMPAALITLPQRSISCGRYLARYSGVRCSGGRISRPRSWSRLRMLGSSTVSLITLLSLRTIGSGVPLGRKNAFHTVASTPGSPCSPVVARSAMIGTRLGAITAMPLTVPCLAWTAPVWMVSHM